MPRHRANIRPMIDIYRLQSQMLPSLRAFIHLRNLLATRYFRDSGKIKLAPLAFPSTIILP